MNHCWVVELNLGSRCPDQVLEAARGSHRSVLISDFSWCSFFFKKCLVTWELWSHSESFYFRIWWVYASKIREFFSGCTRSTWFVVVIGWIPRLFLQTPKLPRLKAVVKKNILPSMNCRSAMGLLWQANQGWEETPSRCFAGQQPRSPLCDETSRSSWKWGPT